MIAKMRMQVGDAIISWGILPDMSSLNSQKVLRAARPKFALIDGGRKATSIAPDEAPLLQAKSA
jgi:hypothetical protein